MDKQAIEKVLIEAVQSTANEDGWSNLAEIGGVLRIKGIKYGKLAKFIAGYPHLLETRIDDTKQPPVVYARVIEEASPENE